VSIPPFTQARCLFVKLSLALLIESCDSWSHINCKTFFSPSVFFGLGWNVLWCSSITPQTWQTRGLTSDEFGGHSSMPENHCRWRQSSLEPTLQWEQAYRPAGKWNQTVGETCVLQLVWVTEFNVTFSVCFSFLLNGRHHNYCFLRKLSLCKNLERNSNCQSVYLHILQKSIEYLNIWTYLNFESFPKLENLSPLNPEILEKNLYRLPRKCTLSGETLSGIVLSYNMH